MRLHHLILSSLVLRLALLGAGCTAATAPSRMQHPMLAADEGGPRLAPFAVFQQPDFDGDPDARASDARSVELRQQVAQSARRLVGQASLQVAGTTLPYDCSGLARAAYLEQGIDLLDVETRDGDNAVRSIYRYARSRGIVYRHGRPAPGDLVFFHDTYDSNRNGRRDDPLTHVGVVEQVDDDGTVTLVNTVSRGVLRYKMNLRYPDRVRDPDSGRRINHYLRKADGGQPSQTTAELFVGFATVIVDAAALPDRRLAAR